MGEAEPKWQPRTFGRWRGMALILSVTASHCLGPSTGCSIAASSVSVMISQSCSRASSTTQMVCVPCSTRQRMSYPRNARWNVRILRIFAGIASTGSSTEIRGANRVSYGVTSKPPGTSHQLAPALELGLARFDQLEVAGLDCAVGVIVRHDDAGREGLRLDQLKPGRHCAVAEQALARAQHHREDQHTEFVDETVLPQCLEQAARTLDKKVRTLFALQPLQR